MKLRNSEKLDNIIFGKSLSCLFTFDNMNTNMNKIFTEASLYQ